MLRVRTGWWLVWVGLLGGLLLASIGISSAMDETVIDSQRQPVIQPNPDARVEAKAYEYAMFQKHCVQCHVSVADPERPGKTRDEWYRIINLMEGHGLNIPQSEADMIVDLLYSLRRGIERDPG